MLVLLAGLSVHAGSMGLAHLQVIRVENDLKRWQEAGRVTSLAAIESALLAIDRANRLHRDNPHQLTLKAHLLAWRAYTTGDTTADGSAAADYRAALELYRQAAALRPLWPNNRAEMINVKLNLKQLDGELDALLRQADKLGPYTLAVHLAIVRAGFATGQRHEQLLQRHLLRGLKDRRSRRHFEQLVRQYGREAAVCQWLNQVQEPRLDLKLCGTRELSAN